MQTLIATIIVALLWLAGGCASEHDQTMQDLQNMHQKVRDDAKNPQPPGKWVMNPGSK